MDFKYIEQLLDRYWKAETSLQEEEILCAFFRQTNIPEHLLPYQSLFLDLETSKTLSLDESFDNRLLSKIKDAEPMKESAEEVTAKRMGVLSSLRPLFQAAAIVAVVSLIGIGAQRSFSSDNKNVWDYNPGSYKDSYENPQEAYHVMEKNLQLFQRTSCVDTAVQKNNITDKNLLSE